MPEATPSGFDAWSRNHPLSTLVMPRGYSSGEGVVVEAFHGTTADFVAFDKKRANVECFHGSGFYFSNNAQDVSVNYAGRGPDLTSKIENEIDRIVNDNEDDDPDTDAIRAKVEARYIAHGGFIMPVYLRFDNPAVLGGYNETILTNEEEYDEDTEEYGELSGTLYDLTKALREVCEDKRWEDTNIELDIDDLLNASSCEEITLERAIDVLKASDGLLGAMDMHTAFSPLASTEVIRSALERMGFDGIIDCTVNNSLGKGRKDKICGMAGMDDETVHFTVFQPTQIKSRIGNAGSYDPEDLDITDRRAMAANAMKALDFIKGLSKKAAPHA